MLKYVKSVQILQTMWRNYAIFYKRKLLLKRKMYTAHTLKRMFKKRNHNNYGGFAKMMHNKLRYELMFGAVIQLESDL